MTPCAATALQPLVRSLLAEERVKREHEARDPAVVALFLGRRDATSVEAAAKLDEVSRLLRQYRRVSEAFELNP